MIGVGFSSTDAFLSRAIRAFSRDPGLPDKEQPSHMWILHDAYGTECVMGEEWTGFGVVTYKWFAKRNRIIHVIPAQPTLSRIHVDARARVDAAAEFLGDGYDFIGLLGHVFKALRHLKSPKRMICQEAVQRFFPELFPSRLGLWEATPAKLLLDGTGRLPQISLPPVR
ncbi:MAG: hypothetical protein A2Y38_13845 [Spirochaetes bacterium GWB1_59_5]|nr:MAG: hypothetical protein A2Y38_13845 [Spirochaetes bacterium GWB1_59_5]